MPLPDPEQPPRKSVGGTQSCLSSLQLQQAAVKALGPAMGLLLHNERHRNTVFERLPCLLQQYEGGVDNIHVTMVRRDLGTSIGACVYAWVCALVHVCACKTCPRNSVALLGLSWCSSRPLNGLALPTLGG